MKNLILASALGTLVGTFAVPAFHGPVHYQITKPHSMFGWAPAISGAGPQTVSVTLGTVPGDFVLTDVAIGGYADAVLVKVNGSPVLCMPRHVAGVADSQVHLTTGILIPFGSSIVVDATTYVTTQTPVTLAGYLQ